MNPQSIAHHLDDEIIWDFVCAKLNFGESLIVRTHIALCPECAKTLAVFEAAGGELLDEIDGVAMNDDALELALARTELKTSESITPKASRREIFGFEMPHTLSNIDVKPRRFLGPNVWIAPITEAKGINQSQTYLLWIKGGQDILPHTHTKREMTLVLHGGFEDGTNSYNAGDFVVCDDSISHAPIMLSDEDCLCLIYQDGPIKPQTLLGHLLKPFARI
jgi:putative transcriptional regulator